MPPQDIEELLRPLELPKNVLDEFHLLRESKRRGELGKGPRNTVLGHSHIVIMTG